MLKNLDHGKCDDDVTEGSNQLAYRRSIHAGSHARLR